MNNNVKAYEIYAAIKNDDEEQAHNLVVLGNLVNEQLDLTNTAAPAFLQFAPTPILIAAYCGSENVFKSLYLSGADIKIFDKLSRNLVHYAMYGKNDYIQSVAFDSQMIDAFDGQGLNAIHHAAIAENNTALNTLLLKGIEFDKPDSFNMTPLAYACQKTSLENVESLISFGASIDFNYMNESLLTLAAIGGSPEIVKFFIDKGFKANSDVVSPIGPPIIAAAKNSHAEACRILLENGADARTMDTERNIPSYYAFQNNNAELLQILIDHGGLDKSMGLLFKKCNSKITFDIAKCLLANGFTEKDIRFAVIPSFLPMNSLDNISELLKLGADINAFDGNYNGLMLACDIGNLETVEFFVNNGANPKLKNKLGVNALMTAAMKGYLNIIQYLLKFIDINDYDNLRMTALHYAVKGNKPEAVKLLLDNGANVNISDKDLQSPLMTSVFIESYEIASMLLEKGADPNAKNKNSYPVLYFAKRRNAEISKLITDHGGKLV